MLCVIHVRDTLVIYSKIRLLVAGDAAAILLFAAIGRINHGGVLDWETISVALPFLVGERELQ
jgi:hypothetical protein